MKCQSLILGCCCLLASCAEMQVKRDLAYAQDVQQYKVATASGAKFDPATLCTTSSEFKMWVTFEFLQTSTIYRLPNGVNAAASCLIVPAGAKAIEIHGLGNQKGISYHEATAIHPSILFLDQDHKMLADLQTPKLTVNDGLSGIGLSGVVTFVNKIASPRFAVIYVHPLSTNDAITVYARSTIHVPHGPYGTIKARFFE